MVRQKSKVNRDRMVKTYSNRHGSNIATFAIGDSVTLFIPGQDRSATDDRRLPARIINKKYNYRSQLLVNSSFRILQIWTRRLYHSK